MPHRMRYFGIIIAVPTPITMTAGRKPTKKPAVGEASETRPLRPPARIGRPAMASTAKISTAKLPFRGPRMHPVSITPRVCRVIGTPDAPIVMVPGRPSAAIRAANTAAWVRSVTDSENRRDDDGMSVFEDMECIMSARR